MTDRQRKWDEDFLALAEFWAKRKSKDPSTQVGSCIVRPDLTVASIGYNGFPRGLQDNPREYDERPTKLMKMVHAEVNALLFCSERPVGYTIYTHPFEPCSVCAKLIIQSGIRRVVSPLAPMDKWERWQDDFELSALLFDEAGVKLDIIRLG